MKRTFLPILMMAPQANAQNNGGALTPEANLENKQEIVKVTVVNGNAGENELLKEVLYNGVPCVTPEQRIDALRKNFQLSVARKFGITPRDENDEPLKNLLVINGTLVRPKLPAIAVDENGGATENMAQYYERTKARCAAAYTTILKGLERIDFMAEMI